MHFVEYMSTHGHEELAVWTDPAVGLKAFVAIHDRTLGPALGGTRIWAHESEDAAIADVLALSRAMTYKSAAAGLPYGGGKGLILADPRTAKTEALLRSYGRFVDTLQGRYITTEDVGANARDMEWISYETRHVVGLPESLGGSGNPSVVTGFGIFQAMRACAEALWGSDDLKGRTVALQGFGNVATSLAGHLREAGATLVVTDTYAGALERAKAMPGVQVVEPDAIFDAPCDIFAPCALGGTINERTIPHLKAAAVVGAANNQLADEQADAARLAERGIAYVPDYIANAGGVINVSYEIGRPYDRAGAMAKAAEIHQTAARILADAARDGVTTVQAAARMAEERIASVRAARRA
ncbi:MAG: Glu/Leu/Phe/Val dehydrogenase dimerization domain-containing protein [Chloroflexota bacterium]